MQDQPIVDQFSPLSHKAPLRGDPSVGGRRWTAPTWVPDADRRRLAAYTVRAAYMGNVARQFLPVETSQKVADDHREYGDAALAVDRIVAGVLGTDWAITVDGADGDPLADGPTVPPMPERPARVADEAAQALLDEIHGERVERWRDDVATELERWRAEVDSQPMLRAREAEVRAWANRARLPARFDEGEHHATGLGDAVYVLWPQTGDWPKVTAEDPGFFFPVWADDGSVEDFPSTVHLAWEFDRTVGGVTRRYVRRITFELVELVDLMSGVDSAGRASWLDRAGTPSLVPQLDPRWERVLADGRVVRRHPWDPDDLPVDQWSSTTCVMSDGTWELSAVGPGGLADLSDAAASWATASDGTLLRRLDLRLPFIPVVHEPNTTTGDHWGRSAIDLVAQVLDDVAQSDSDIMGASRYLGHPTLAVSGAKAPDSGTVAPGVILGLGQTGKMDVLDLSAGLEQLLKAGDRLQDRYWQNVRIPSEVVGRASDEAVAGITLVLRLGPWASLIGSARQARDPRREMFFRFAMRMAMAAGAIDPGPVPRIRMQWGNFMPTNRAETVTLVATALNAHAISTQTAVSMLVASGLPVEDAQAEVERIHAENTAAAKELSDAVGVGSVPGEQAAAARLGVTLPPSAGLPPAPTLDIPAGE